MRLYLSCSNRNTKNSHTFHIFIAMKKISLLLGAALLLASAANAQVRTLTPAAPSAVGANPNTVSQPTSAAGPVTLTGRPALGTTTAGGGGGFNNDSYLEQVGDNQRAFVTQTGAGSNTSDILQSSAAGTGGNYAKQTQESLNLGYTPNPENNANIKQYGTGSSAIQDQRGTQNKEAIQQGASGVASSGNFASQIQRSPDPTRDTGGNNATIKQNTTVAGGDNSATQEQQSSGGKVSASQQGSRNKSVQKQGVYGYDNATVTQTGNDNYAKQDQSPNGGSNIAELTQTGNRNQAEQTQSGYNNQALVEQTTNDNVASQTQQGGGFNYAETKQGGTAGVDAGYSMTVQTGNNNTAVVHQGQP
ncbi:minor curlin subunit [Hymenobacter sp. UYAg731]